MNRFLEISLSFPVVVFSFMLLVAVLFWLVALLGLFDVDIHSVEADGALDGVGGLLMKVGLDGVPVTIVFTLVALFSWLTAYLSDLYVLHHFETGLFSLALSLVTMVVATVAGAIISGFVIQPLRPFFKKIEAPSALSIIGHVATVRSGHVTEEGGVAVLEDGGASMILDVRTINGAIFKRGEKVVLLEYQHDKHCYIVMGEDEFNR